MWVSYETPSSLPRRDYKNFPKMVDFQRRWDRTDLMVKEWTLGQMAWFESNLYHI